MINFAAISPHAPILLPNVGSEEDRKKVKKTIESLEFLAEKLAEMNPDKIIISSPHPDWGFEAPLYFLAKDLHANSAPSHLLRSHSGNANALMRIEKILIGLESPKFYFEKGKEIYMSNIKGQMSRVALIASGDLSHCLRADGPYGFILMAQNLTRP